MGQRLQDDKIGQLSESGGTITLAPSLLTIGGQQYSTESLDVTADVTDPNTRYQVYAVRNAGVIELVVSENENSVGPAGYSAWKLVGSYYTNGLSLIGFGSFVNISGVPRTNQPILFNMILDSTTSTPPTRGTVDEEISWWQRDGRNLIFRHDYNHTAAGSNGTGTVKYSNPAGFEWDVDFYSGNNWQSPLGPCTLFIGSAQGDGTAEINTPSAVIVNADTTSSDQRAFQSPTWYAYSNTQLRVGFEVRGICEQFDEMSIEDL